MVSFKLKSSGLLHLSMRDTSFLVEYLEATINTVNIAANVPISAVAVVAMYF